jgi:hypothetical protein
MCVWLVRDHMPVALFEWKATVGTMYINQRTTSFQSPAGQGAEAHGRGGD